MSNFRVAPPVAWRRPHSPGRVDSPHPVFPVTVSHSRLGDWVDNRGGGDTKVSLSIRFIHSDVIPPGSRLRRRNHLYYSFRASERT
jgi:hypothetical protein